MLQIKQNTQEWLDFRRNKIGASDAPIIMGVSPWKTAYQLWEEKVGLRSPSAQSFAMKRGTEMEDTARRAFSSRMGLKFEPKVILHPIYGFMMASLDGFNEENRLLVEIKCPGMVDHGIAVDGEIPEKYMAQLQHQMECADVEMMYYYSFGVTEGIVIEVERDRSYIANMIDKEREFYNCLTTLEAPTLTDRDYRMQDSERFFELEKLYWEQDQIEKTASDFKNSYRKEMLSIADGHPSCGKMFKISKTFRRGSIDEAKALRDGVPLDKYRKDPIQSWRITAQNHGL